MIQSRHTSALSGRLGQFTLRLIVRILLVDTEVLVLLTSGFAYRRTFLDRLDPFAEARPGGLVITTLALLGDTEAVFVVVEDPEADCESKSI